MHQGKFEISLQPSIAPKLVFIDAIARSGKAIFSDLIPSLSKMEHIQFCTEFELTIQGLALEAISQNYANAFMRIYFNELAYNLQISRNVNFRKSDQTGVPNFRDPSIYYKRLDREDGDSIVDICRCSDGYIPINTHELLVNYEQLSKLDIDYKMISLWRNPVDVVYSWVKRGWGHRYQENDPRSFMFNIFTNDQIYPWHFAFYKDEIGDCTGAELCARVVMLSIDKALKNFAKVPMDRIRLVTFEEACTNPKKMLGDISEWLKLEESDYTKHACKKADVPRPLYKLDFEKKADFLKSQVTTSTFEKLMEYSDLYDLSLYGLRS